MTTGVERLNSTTSSRESEGHCETDRITSIELEKNRRVLYFSDGTLELDTDSDEIDIPDRHHTEYQEPISLLSRVKNNMHRLGSSVLAGIDYVGEELASFFGITSKQEWKGIEYYKQNTASVNPEEGVNSNWVNGFNNNEQETPTRVPITSEMRN